MPNRQGSIRLFRFDGIDVFLHWSWFLVAAFEISNGSRRYSSLTWNVLEYLALFLIVMLHEFGHALACRQVGGTANQIVLWPLGGVAYVNPPQRPGATLWSIAAGPLVNVVLLPVLFALVTLSRWLGWAEAMPDVYALLRAVWLINVGLLIFNMLPIYPLDGGQILRSLLWFVTGTRTQLDGGREHRFAGGRRLHYSRPLAPFRLVCGARRLHADELLGWAATSTGAVTFWKIAASGRFCLSAM